MLSNEEKRLAVIRGHLLASQSRCAHTDLGATSLASSLQRDVFFEGKENGAQFISLNRPDQLNALNQGMINSMGQWLSEWEDDAKVTMVIVRGIGKAFCAGGDIRALAQAARAKNAVVPRNFFGPEYILVDKIFKYPKPYIALLDGITMGGGVGISIGAMFRIATEKLLFAMPETGIGFVTDVGAGHFLTRLKGPKGVGLYLGLTGARIGAADCMYTGVASHFVKSENIPALVDALSSLAQPSKETIEKLLVRFQVPSGEPPLSKIGPLIEYCFGSASSVEDIMNKLDSISSKKFEIKGVTQEQAVTWANATTKTLNTRCPLSLKVVFKLLEHGKFLNIKGSLELEYRIVMRMVLTCPSFYEGVRAVIIDKDNKPVWQPSNLAGVTEEHLSSLFKEFSAQEISDFGPELFG
eukprot:Phypoly_transcript_10320.p1 GENE.Phypoly_transcript_10320~~Phypoly_transcript_10320.p1  ORF type:complete len:411 (+),score=37.58 Phypoly_transcript_10320:65-1297(+)